MLSRVQETWRLTQVSTITPFDVAYSEFGKILLQLPYMLELTRTEAKATRMKQSRVAGKCSRSYCRLRVFTRRLFDPAFSIASNWSFSSRNWSLGQERLIWSIWTRIPCSAGQVRSMVAG